MNHMPPTDPPSQGMPPGPPPPPPPGGPPAGLPGSIPPTGYPGVPPRYAPPPKPPFDYSGLIKGTLGLTWRHKFLWFFGLFAWGSTTFGGWSGNFNYSTGGDGPGDTGDASEISDFISAHLGLIVAIALAIFFLSLLVWLWSIICRGAVIGSARDIEEGRPSGFGLAFRHGLDSFGRLLLLDLLLLAIGLGIAIIATAAILLIVFLIMSLGDAGQTIALVFLGLLTLWIIGLLIMGFGYLTCFTVWFAVWVPVSLILFYGTRVVVLERHGPIEGLRVGWRLMIGTLSRSLLLYLLSAGLNIAGNIGGVLIVGISSIPAVVAWILTYTTDWPAAGIVASSLLSLVPFAVLLLFVAVLNTYFTSFWTTVYLRLTGRIPEAGAETAA